MLIAPIACQLSISGAIRVDRKYLEPSGGFQIFAINPDGAGDTQLTSDGSNEHPRWSPDGRYIAFSSKRGGKESIFIMRSDGSGQAKVSLEILLPVRFRRFS